MKAGTIVAVLGLEACCFCALDAADRKPTYTDAARADADFSVQGEYAGELLSNGEKRKHGVQVIALGGGRFDAYVYPGGLPGDGWDKKKDPRRGPIKGKTEGGVTTFDKLSGTATIQDGTMSIVDASGDEIGKLQRTIRRSKTLGKEPPVGGIVLFDGKNTDNFVKGRMTDDGFLMQGTRSKRKFQDVFLHLEFRTPYQPFHRGQGRGNSGCYLQSRYEVQVLDSFGLEGKHDEAGGIYSMAPPKVNMCYPPLSWQTYDIEFRAAKFGPDGKKTEHATLSVWHNGVQVHENQPVDHATTAAPEKESPEPGPLYLQHHGNPVVYRNLWVVER